MKARAVIGSIVLAGVVLAAGGSLVYWKVSKVRAAASGGGGYERSESVTAVEATLRPYRPTTTAVGTIVALRSITLRNELVGTVAETRLQSGKIVEPGEVLLRLDDRVEQAELAAAQAMSTLATATLGRLDAASSSNAVSQTELDRSRAERDRAQADIRRLEVLIDKKTIRAPFRARVGMVDTHEGQYLAEGTEITTLQGLDDQVHVDFAVPQTLAASLREGAEVELTDELGRSLGMARVVASDALVDRVTRNATLRALATGPVAKLVPGASVRVRVPAGEERQVVVVPVTAIRRGPSGDHVFVIANDEKGVPRAKLRAVTSGAFLGNDAIVLSGLEAGERVAASGSFKLMEGMMVNLGQPGGPSGAPGGGAAGGEQGGAKAGGGGEAKDASAGK